MSLYSTAYLLDSAYNISEASRIQFPLLTGWVHTFEETLDWLQFAYNLDRIGAYMAPVSTVLAQSSMLEGDTIFL